VTCFVADYDSGLLRRGDRDRRCDHGGQPRAGLQPFGLVATRAGNCSSTRTTIPTGRRAPPPGPSGPSTPAPVRRSRSGPHRKSRGVAQLRWSAGPRGLPGTCRATADPTDASLAVLAGSGCPGFARRAGNAPLPSTPPYGLVVAPDRKNHPSRTPATAASRVLDLNGNAPLWPAGTPWGRMTDRRRSLVSDSPDSMWPATSLGTSLRQRQWGAPDSAYRRRRANVWTPAG